MSSKDCSTLSPRAWDGVPCRDGFADRDEDAVARGDRL
jgi:hypothetical protein